MKVSPSLSVSLLKDLDLVTRGLR